eukprot:CAMPEP_0196700252 /NCGR_PEP_ID=MMETSP1090-20130531/48886_1 /TAXON_ID=37098 /ORGANISM="Isochrysis sp, Strain CCMP1244" /LENGTH=69 /DNA_ID=CAMNT_0042039981 /DNA_START=179 /DNA_END=388 /DNA_ORIENTATION=+
MKHSDRYVSANRRCLCSIFERFLSESTRLACCSTSDRSAWIGQKLRYATMCSLKNSWAVHSGTITTALP